MSHTSTTHRIAIAAVAGLAIAGSALAASAAPAMPATARAHPASAGHTTDQGLDAADPSRSALCHYAWGSLPKINSTYVAGPIENLRSGRHTCFDRIVVDLTGRAPGYRVEYVRAIVQDGSGTVMPVRGGARLKITVNAPAYDADGDIHYQPANPAEAVNVAGYQTLRQVRWLGSFEGTSEIGVGVRARLPMRVTRLSDGSMSRLVVDVAHNW